MFVDIYLYYDIDCKCLIYVWFETKNSQINASSFDFIKISIIKASIF